MERSLRKVAFAGAVLTILCWPARASAADPNKDVRVVNTPAESVPVTVVNPAAAPVHVAGHVTLAGTPSVGVASLPSDPFQKHVANLLLYDTIELTTVPAGKRLVIEYINAFEGATGQFDYLTISTSDDEGGVVLAIPFLNSFVDAHPRIIVGPNRTVTVRNFGSADATLTVSGHYEPAPSVQ